MKKRTTVTVGTCSTVLVLLLAWWVWPRRTAAAGPPLLSGTLGENLDRLEGAVPPDVSWPILEPLAVTAPAEGILLPPPAASAAELAAAQQALEDNRALLPALREAGAKTFLGKPHTGGGAGGLAIPFVDIDRFRDLAHLLLLDAREARRAGRWRDAWSDVEAAGGLVRQLERRPGLIEQLWGSMLCATVAAEFQALVREHADGWTDAELAELGASPLLDPPRRSLAEAMEGEHLFALHALDLYFSGSAVPWLGPGDGLPSLTEAIHAGREETAQTVEDKHRFLLGMAAMTPAARRACVVPESILPTGAVGRRRLFLASLVLPPNEYQAMADALDQELMLADTNRTMVALVRWRQVHGDWPERLEQLVPEYLPALPFDAADGGTLDYHVDAEGPVLR